MIGCMVLGGIALVAGARLLAARSCWHGRGLAFSRCGGWRAHRRWGGPHPFAGGDWGVPLAGDGFDDADPDVHPDGDPWRRHRSRGGFVLRAVLDRLEVSPAQGKTIRAAWDEMRAELRTLSPEPKQTRADLAAALRKPAFDEVLLGELFARHDEALRRARKAFVGFTSKVHDVLEEEQRARLATMLERGPRSFLRTAW